MNKLFIILTFILMIESELVPSIQ